LGGAPVGEQQQQQQQQRLQQQQSSQSSDPQSRQSPDSQQQSQQQISSDPIATHQPNEHQPDESLPSIAGQHFDLTQHDATAPTCQLFDVASNCSSESQASDADDHDDAYWEAQLIGTVAPVSPASAIKRPHPPDSESSPAKRKRPG